MQLTELKEKIVHIPQYTKMTQKVEILYINNVNDANI